VRILLPQLSWHDDIILCALTAWTSVCLLTQMGKVVDCFKSLCSALYVVARSSYAPCAHARTAAELVHGETARKAVLHLEDMRTVISQCRTR
jgi:hypothetical protein